MIEEQAIIIRIDGERAFLEVERSQPCGMCGATRGCGISMWGRIFGRRQGTFSAINSLKLGVGERVIIGVEESALLSSSLMAYILPLLMLCLGAWLVPLLLNVAPLARATSDFHAFVGAAMGLAGGLLLVKLLTSSKRTMGRYQPVMLRRSETIFIKQCSR